MSVLVWEAICVGRYSAWTVLHDFALRIPVEWLVRILILTSMTLQLVLVVLGARRYLTSSGILRFMVWGAYISADAVAISSLGTMMHSARSGIYAIWAPLLLMHLGGPDAITAYSMADNELWLRHGFNMVYQVSVAAYVIYGSSLKGRPLAAAILLLLVGFAKYAERTLALWYGSYPRIVFSSLPISKRMENESVAKKCEYVVMGEDQLERMIEKEQTVSSAEERGTSSANETEIQEELGTSSSNETRRQEGLGTSPAIETGIQEELETDSLKGREVVTIQDVERAKIGDIGYKLCLSHALFKMYKRRFGSLYFVEGDHPKTRDFWVNRSGKEAFRIVEMELKFIYDAVFSKYSNAGFTKWGMVVRFLITILLGAAGYLILGEQESRQAQRMVTYIVISVAFVVEVFQIWRVIVSDWTRVHLICAYVVASKPQESHTAERCRFCHILKCCTFCNILQCSTFCHILQCCTCFRNILQRCRCQVIKITMVVLGTFQDFIGGKRYLREIVGGNRYWSNRIPQHCLVETWLHRSPIICKMTGLLSKPERSIVSWYSQIRHVHKVSVEDDLKEFIFKILTEPCSQNNSIEKFKENVYNFEKYPFEGKTEIPEVLKSHGNLEEVILIWHIATTLCVWQKETKKESLQNDETEKYAKRSIILSRYCAYLLLSRPNLLPLHPKMARIVYMQLVNQLLDTLPLSSFLQKNLEYLLRCKDNDDLLGSGAKLADQLLRIGEFERWKLVADYWGKLLIYMAVYNKAIYHAECVAAGGEFLSLVWVLLAHMGCGEQSDSAVTKKVEMQADNEFTLSKRNIELYQANIKMNLTALRKKIEAVAERRTEQDAAEMRRTLIALGRKLEAVAESTEQDPAKMRTTLIALGKELEAVAERTEQNAAEMRTTLSACGKELDDVAEKIEQVLAKMNRTLTDRIMELDRLKKAFTAKEEELAAMKKAFTAMEEELAATKKASSDRENKGLK